MNILQAQMNKYTELILIMLWLKVTKAAEPRHQNHTRTLFIAPQKDVASAPPAFSKQNK
jgi:hypothetical protein